MMARFYDAAAVWTLLVSNSTLPEKSVKNLSTWPDYSADFFP